MCVAVSSARVRRSSVLHPPAFGEAPLLGGRALPRGRRRSRAGIGLGLGLGSRALPRGRRRSGKSSKRVLAGALLVSPSFRKSKEPQLIPFYYFPGPDPSAPRSDWPDGMARLFARTSLSVFSSSEACESA